MHIGRRQHGQVLVILLGALFLGGGVATGVITTGMSLKDLDKRIKDLDLSEAREEEARDFVSQWEDVTRSALKQREDRIDRILELLGDKATSDAELHAAFGDLHAEGDETLANVLSLRDELRTLLSEGEWNRLFADK